MACGFRNIERFQNAIMFHFGELDLYPRFTHIIVESPQKVILFLL